MPLAYVYAREREESLRQRRALTGEKTQNAMRNFKTLTVIVAKGQHIVGSQSLAQLIVNAQVFSQAVNNNHQSPK